MLVACYDASTQTLIALDIAEDYKGLATTKALAVPNDYNENIIFKAFVWDDLEDVVPIASCDEFILNN